MTEDRIQQPSDKNKSNKTLLSKQFNENQTDTRHQLNFQTPKSGKKEVGQSSNKQNLEEIEAIISSFIQEQTTSQAVSEFIDSRIQEMGGEFKKLNREDIREEILGKFSQIDSHSLQHSFTEQQQRNEANPNIKQESLDSNQNSNQNFKRKIQTFQDSNNGLIKKQLNFDFPQEQSTIDQLRKQIQQLERQNGKLKKENQENKLKIEEFSSKNEKIARNKIVDDDENNLIQKLQQKVKELDWAYGEIDGLKQKIIQLLLLSTSQENLDVEITSIYSIPLDSSNQLWKRILAKAAEKIQPEITKELGSCFGCRRELEKQISFTNCCHIFHHECLVENMKHKPCCPECQQPQKETDLFSIEFCINQKKTIFPDLPLNNDKIPPQNLVVNSDKLETKKLIIHTDTVLSQNQLVNSDRQLLKNQVENLIQNMNQRNTSQMTEISEICTPREVKEKQGQFQNFQTNVKNLVQHNQLNSTSQSDSSKINSSLSALFSKNTFTNKDSQIIQDKSSVLTKNVSKFEESLKHYASLKSASDIKLPNYFKQSFLNQDSAKGGPINNQNPNLNFVQSPGPNQKNLADIVQLDSKYQSKTANMCSNKTLNNLTYSKFCCNKSQIPQADSISQFQISEQNNKSEINFQQKFNIAPNDSMKQQIQNDLVLVEEIQQKYLNNQLDANTRKINQSCVPIFDHSKDYNLEQRNKSLDLKEMYQKHKFGSDQKFQHLVDNSQRNYNNSDSRSQLPSFQNLNQSSQTISNVYNVGYNQQTEQSTLSNKYINNSHTYQRRPPPFNFLLG